MAFTSVTLTGSFANRVGGTPARGYVSFQLSAPLINGTVISPAVEEKKHLTNGAFSIVLPATNDVGTTPTGGTYTVTEHIEGSEENTYSIELVYTDITQDLADIVPTTNVDLYYYLSKAAAPYAAIASPTAPGAAYVQAEAAAMKTAVDAIRVALTNVGVTL